MIVFIGLATNDFISNRPLLVISRIAPSVSRFMQNTSGALTVPSLRRLPLSTSMSDTFVPGTIEPLAVLQNRFRFCSICSNRHVTAAFFPFPCISSYSFFYRLRRQKVCAARAFYSSGECVEYITGSYFVSSTLLFFFRFFLLFFSFFYRFLRFFL